MPEFPCIKPWYRVVADGSADRLLVKHGGSLVIFRGRAARRLLPPLLALLDGTHRLEEIHAIMGTEVRSATIGALERLASHGLLHSGPPVERLMPASVRDSATELAARTEGTGLAVHPRECLETIARSRIAVVGTGPLAAEICRLLRLSGVGTVDPETGAPDARRLQGSNAVVVGDSVDDPALARWNDAALETPLTWMQVLPHDGALAVVGPLYVPGETACYQCFRIRRWANSSSSNEERAWGQALASGRRLGGVIPVSAPMSSMTASLAVHLLLESLVATGLVGSPLGGFFHTIGIGFRGPELATHCLYRVPRCPACSPARGGGYPDPWFPPPVEPLQGAAGPTVGSEVAHHA